MGDADRLGGRVLVVFDGYCGLCKRSVRWFLRRDRYDRLRFTPSTSAVGSEVLVRHGFDPLAGASSPTPNSILVVEALSTSAEGILVRSDAVLALLGRLPAPWPAVAALGRLIPRWMRDPVYRAVAHFRYRVWGRLLVCPTPTPDERERFLW